MTTIPQHHGIHFLEGLEHERADGWTIVFDAEVHFGYQTRITVSHAYDTEWNDQPIPQLWGIDYARMREQAEEAAYA